MNHNFGTSEIIIERLEEGVRAYFLTNDHHRNKKLNEIIMNWGYERVYLTEMVFPTTFNGIYFKREALYILKGVL